MCEKEKKKGVAKSQFLSLFFRSLQVLRYAKFTRGKTSQTAIYEGKQEAECQHKGPTELRTRLLAVAHQMCSLSDKAVPEIFTFIGSLLTEMFLLLPRRHLVIMTN